MKSKKRSGCGAGIVGLVVVVGLFVGGIALGGIINNESNALASWLPKAKLPVIMLAAEPLPVEVSQVILLIGLVVFMALALWMALYGKWWMLLVVLLGVGGQCAIYYGREIPNTLPSTWLTMAMLLSLALLYQRASRRSARKGAPPSRFQVALEAVGDGLESFVKSVAGERARMFLPLVATFFIFITVNNWCGVLPGFGSVGVKVAHHAEEAHAAEPAAVEEDAHADQSAMVEPDEAEAAGHGEEEEVEVVPFFRSANAHLSTTLALSLISVAAAQYFGLKVLGAAYLGKYINFRASSPKPDPDAAQGLQGAISKGARVVEIGINGIVGLLEILLEALKVLPFSFRLFGNIFAGEVLLFVVSYLFAFIFPVLFLGLEVFVGAIQGLIFSMLTLVFFAIAATSHHDHGGESH